MNKFAKLIASALIPFVFKSSIASANVILPVPSPMRPLALNHPQGGSITLKKEIDQTADLEWKTVSTKRLMYSSIQRYTYTAEDINRHIGGGTMKLVCIDPESQQCTILMHRPSVKNRMNVYMIYTGDEIDREIFYNAPVIPGIAYVKVDPASYDQLRAQAARYTYQLGDNDDVDEKLLLCGVGVGGCTLSIFLGGPISAGLTCLGSTIACAYAFKAMKKYQDAVNNGEVEAPSQIKPGKPAEKDDIITTPPPHSAGGGGGSWTPGAGTGTGSPQLKCVRSKVSVNGKGFVELNCFLV